MRKIKWILIVLALVLVGIQFIPVSKSDIPLDKSGDLIVKGYAQGDIAAQLKASCYDCHSLETHYPWYAKIAPSSWLVAHDIKEGREELNFSKWNSYTKREKIGFLDEIQEQVKSGEMPMAIYLPFHPQARISEDMKVRISAWAQKTSDSILEQ